MDVIPSMVSCPRDVIAPTTRPMSCRVAALLRSDVAAAAVAVLTSDGHDGRTYDITGREAFTLTEAAAEMSRFTGKHIEFRDETREEAYASRAGFGAPDWEVEGWVTSYEAIGAGELALVTDEVARLTGHEPTTLTEFLAAHPESLAHVKG